MNFFLAILAMSYLKYAAAFVRPAHACCRISSSGRKFFMASTSDTIFSLSSGPVTKTGVAVIRISGPESRRCLETLMTKPDSTKPITFPEPRKASLRRLFCPKTGDMLDHALVLWFPGPRSFTGEDIVELHCHGGRAVILGLFAALEDLDEIKGTAVGTSNSRRIRPAERGEYTRRAFENGRMDLTEVEGLADLLAADTSEQRKQALKQMDGYLKDSFEGWRAELLGCLAHTEAVIDFGDDDREDDINDSAMWALAPRIKKLKQELEVHLMDGRRGELVRDGIKIALAGPPNAGKSSLMNALAKRPAAIVSPIAGTTRDIVEVRLDLGGIPCIVSDTAGLRTSSDDPIEIEGMKRAKEAFRQAQLKVFVGDSSDEQSLREARSMLGSLLKEFNEDDDFDKNAGGDNEVEGGGGGNPYRVLMVMNKADLIQGDQEQAKKVCEDIFQIPTTATATTAAASNTATTASVSITATSAAVAPSSFHLVSCTSGSGLQELESALTKSIKSLLEAGAGEGTLITRERHRRHVKQCVEHLDEFLSRRLPMDAAAEELRLAMMELGKVTGRVDVEELLDIIFRDFCIGK